MTKNEYYKLVLKHQLYRKFDYMLSLFCLTDYSQLKPIPYSLTVDKGSYYYHDSDLNKVKIDNSDSSKPLFKYLETLQVDSDWLVNIKEPLETTYGNLYVNAIIAHVLKDKIPFLAGSFRSQLGNLEQIIADRLIDDVPEGSVIPEGKISVSEYLQVASDIQTLEELGPFVIHSATPRNIQPPRGLKQFKEKLLKEYKDKLDDPIAQIEITKKLQAFDEEWLKDDPSNNIVISGKAKKVARTKSYLISGSALSFTEELSKAFNVKAYADGSETDPKKIAISNSIIRYGSYARGSLTAVAGTIAKAFMQMFTSITVEDRDCGTILTRSQKFSGKKNMYIGRNAVVNGEIVPITIDNINDFMGNTVDLRTPSYCKEGENEVCRVCAGENLWRFRESLTQAGTDLSNTIIYKVYFSVLKGQEAVAVDVDIDDFVK